MYPRTDSESAQWKEEKVEGWDKNRILFNVLPLLSRLPPVSLSFLTSTEYANSNEWLLQGQLISSTSYYEYLWLPSSCMRCSSTPGRLLSRCHPFFLIAFTAGRLFGGELKHIRAALDSGSIANGGREFAVPSRHWRVLVSSSKVPRIPKLSPNITVTHSVPLLADCRTATGQLS